MLQENIIAKNVNMLSWGDDKAKIKVNNFIGPIYVDRFNSVPIFDLGIGSGWEFRAILNTRIVISGAKL